MNRGNLLLAILDQSYIMKSALEAGDFEVFEGALAVREENITALVAMGEGEMTSEEREIMEKITAEHEDCVFLLEKLKAQTLEHVRETKVALSNARKSDNAQNSYQVDNDLGTRFDYKQ